MEIESKFGEIDPSNLIVVVFKSSLNENETVINNNDDAIVIHAIWKHFINTQELWWSFSSIEGVPGKMPLPFAIDGTSRAESGRTLATDDNDDIDTIKANFESMCFDFFVKKIVYF